MSSYVLEAGEHVCHFVAETGVRWGYRIVCGDDECGHELTAGEVLHIVRQHDKMVADNARLREALEAHNEAFRLSGVLPRGDLWDHLEAVREAKERAVRLTKAALEANDA